MPCVHFVMWTARVCPLFTGPVIAKGRGWGWGQEPPWSDAASREGQLWGRETEFRSCPAMCQEGPFWGLLFLIGTFCKPECAMDVACSHYTWGLMGAAS